LEELVCDNNQISRLDVSKNTKLRKLIFFNNENIELIGLRNLLELTSYDDSRGTNTIHNLIIKEELAEIANFLGISQKIASKSLDQTRKIVETEIKQQQHPLVTENIVSGILSLILFLVISGWLIDW
jgi:hypothetical protein